MALKDHYGGEVEFIVADFNDPETRQLLEREEFYAQYIPMLFFIDRDSEVVSEEAGVFSFEERSAASILLSESPWISKISLN